MSDKIVMYRESLLQSILSDIVTFGLSIVCMSVAFYFGSVVWEVITVGIYAIGVTSKVIANGGAVKMVYSKEELLEYAKTLNKLDKRQ